jgi:hypothetical protein
MNGVAKGACVTDDQARNAPTALSVARACGVSDLARGAEAVEYLVQMCDYELEKLTPDYDLLDELNEPPGRGFRGMFRHFMRGERASALFEGLTGVPKACSESGALTVQNYLAMWVAARTDGPK